VAGLGVIWDEVKSEEAQRGVRAHGRYNKSYRRCWGYQIAFRRTFNLRRSHGDQRTRAARVAGRHGLAFYIV